MALKTFLATVEVRVVVDVPEDFSEDDFNGSLEVRDLKGLMIGKHKVDDIQILDVSSEEHTDEDAES